MKKWDFLLITILLAAAGLLYLFFSLRKPDNVFYAAASVDGKEIGRWSLRENGEYDIDTEFGHNRLKIENGYALMIEADCPDGYCMMQEKIGENGGMIVCLPHHLIIETVDGEGNNPYYGDLDAVAQ